MTRTPTTPASHSRLNHSPDGGEPPADVLPHQPGPNDAAWDGWIHPEDWPSPDLPALDEGAYRALPLSYTPGREDPTGEGWGPIAVIFASAFMLTLLIAAIAWPLVQARMAESAAQILEK